MELSVIYLTVKDKSAAISLAKTLLNERLVACANIVEGVTSLYHWEGKLEQASEVILLAKTQKNLSEKALKRAAELHDYTCPCILAISPENAHPAFISWVFAETGA